MEAAWVHNSPHVVFWRRLLNERVDELVNSPDWLKRLRFAHDEVRWWRKNCGHIFEERGLNLYHLIAQAYGEVWDEEDEQKCAQAEEEKVDPSVLKRKTPTSRHAVRLDHPRQGRLRPQQEEEPVLQVRPSDERREGLLQEGRRQER